MSVKVDYLMVGGFLGAGKTTALLQLARRLTAHGRHVGLITNDQSHGLADTALLSAHGFPVEEIAGGCLCCRFDALGEALERMAHRAAPDVILAEPVGSCTDLRATVQYPLRRLYGDCYRVGPLSVLVDPLRALRMVGEETGRPFSPKVVYVYEKQLEEADLIVINKCDLVDDRRAALLEGALRERNPGAAVLRVSAREGTGLDRWLSALAAEAGSPEAPQVDYDLYAAGESLLGWLNGTMRVNAPAPFDGNAFMVDLEHRIRRILGAAGIAIASLKMNFAREDDTAAGTLMVNLRAEGAPEALRVAVEAALSASGLGIEFLRMECFRPARPVPTHRIGNAPR